MSTSNINGQLEDNSKAAGNKEASYLGGSKDSKPPIKHSHPHRFTIVFWITVILNQQAVTFLLHQLTVLIRKPNTEQLDLF